MCPVDCIPLDPEVVETREELLAKYERLQAEKVLGEGRVALDVEQRA